MSWTDVFWGFAIVAVFIGLAVWLIHRGTLRSERRANNERASQNNNWYESGAGGGGTSFGDGGD